MFVKQATVSAPVNIACIKYWGKRNESLILPTNPSLSVTLSQDHLCSTTTSRTCAEYEENLLWLNGKEVKIDNDKRLNTCLQAMRKQRERYEAKYPNEPKISKWKVHICSENNFPTAAGLASSASGFAALAYSLAHLYDLPLSDPADISDLSLNARQGSGSACRSLFGGFVEWQMGRDDLLGSDSRAVQVADHTFWPEIHALICIVSDDKKGTSSTAGMQRTVETSALFQYRIQHVEEQLVDIKQAILKKDFDTFAKITMQDSNQFHAVALDTDPPIFYMNDVSRAIIGVVTEYNRVSIAAGGKRKAAYTFDAGPNAVIYAPGENMKEIIGMIIQYFPQPEPFKDPFLNEVIEGTLVPGFNSAVAKRHEVGAVKGLIHTCVGDGPRVLGDEHALFDANGKPKQKSN
ncbi:GHMP kinase [Pisolithus tinctorius]|uniref:Diphosphomevalonate decarboxylase n=1 Tax=Pisolithus tinctorius Marx 270 TaxID=870435 RepID=A0A0C3PMB9_PISTI|nr:GHMP kinase [Pisolithus tinctorius]KIO09474.1 hypothetical protein M404DRAFT_996320 [Pisolithus tinctorius Marx 270]